MSTQPTIALSRRIPHLDGLRGVAILTILVSHYLGFAAQIGAPNFVELLLAPLSIGWAGVDLFFVLSGFLIGGILLDAKGSTNFFRVFYARRACRILPLYFAFIFSAPFCSRLLGFPIFAPWHVFPLFLQNFWMAAHNASLGQTVDPTWSLAVEEQFYLTLPAVIYFVKRDRLPAILIAGIIGAPLLRLGLFFFVPGSDMSTFVLTPCRMDSLLFGVLAAYLIRLPAMIEFLTRHRRRIWLSIEALTIVCCLWFFWPPRGARADAFTYGALAMLFALVTLLSFVDDGLRRVLSMRLLRSMGRVSYFVYLAHELAFFVALRFVPHVRYAGLVTAAGGLLLTLAAAEISWRFFERPLISLGHRARYHFMKPASTDPALDAPSRIQPATLTVKLAGPVSR